MKKERIETITDSFTDSNGNIRFFTIAAISEVFPDDNVIAYFYDKTIVKGLKVGYSICNPIDRYDAKLGETIAIGRARKNNSYALYVTKAGYISTELVKAFLEREAKYLKENPQLYIKGYK